VERDIGRDAQIHISHVDVQGGTTRFDARTRTRQPGEENKRQTAHAAMGA
jgi:hypothetical protein